MKKKSERIHRKQAVALQYDAKQQSAPEVLAKGQGLIADKIIAIARENDIHVHENPQLVALLSQLKLNSPIPEELYKAVAEVLAFVYRLDRREID